MAFSSGYSPLLSGAAELASTGYAGEAAPLPHIGLLLVVQVDCTGTVAKTLGSLSVAAAGGPVAGGTLAKTLGVATSSGAGSVVTTGTLAKTLGGVVIAAAGGSGDGIGGVVQTLGALSTSIAGTVLVTGTTTRTLGTLAVSTVGSTVILGTLAKTLGTTAIAASGAVTAGFGTGGDPAPLPHIGLALYDSGIFVGSVVKTLGALTASSAAYIPPDEITPYDWDDTAPAQPAYYPQSENLDWTQSDVVVRSDTGGAVGVVVKNLTSLYLQARVESTIDGVVNQTLGVITSASTAAVGSTAVVDKTLGALTGSSAASVDSNFVATLAQQLSLLSSSGSGGVEVVGTLAKSLASASATGTGTVTGGDYIATLTRTLGAVTSVARAETAISGGYDNILGALTGTLAASTLDDIVVSVNQELGPMTCFSEALSFTYELGVRRRWTSKGAERRIGSKKARAVEREIEGELVE